MPRSKPKSSRLNEALRLRQLRGFLQLSQRDLATEFRVGHAAISSWESGARTIPGPILKLIEIYEKEAGLSAIDDLEYGWFSRNFRLSATIAGITARLAGHSLLKLFGSSGEPFSEVAAQKMAETMSDLKGLIMKAGQMMSYTDFGLADSVRKRFAVLLDHSTPLLNEKIVGVLEAELGASDLHFQSWNPVPIGVGSIGQVHEAKLLDGTPVAVKVQYPEILKLMESDLAYTHFIQMLGPVLFPKQDRHALIEELRERAQDECDYLKESGFQERLRHCFLNDPEMVIPRVYPKWTTQKVLTQERIEGKRFYDFVEQATQEEKNQAGRIIFKNAFQSVFLHQLVNADPHPGNYLFLNRRVHCADLKVAFVDFGGTLALTPDFVQRWRSYIQAVSSNDHIHARQLVIEMGYVPNPKSFDFDAHFELMKNLHAPWLTQGSFRFTREYLIRSWHLMLNNVNRSKLNLPREWVLINRLQWGLYSVLAILNAEQDWREIMQLLVLE